ncbi:unnamed protein product, partial [Rotaria sp. Silwood2]
MATTIPSSDFAVEIAQAYPEAK